MDILIGWCLRAIVNRQLAQILNYEPMAIFIYEEVTTIAANIASRR